VVAGLTDADAIPLTTQCAVEQRPSPRQILETAEGERLQAGYLLRRSADGIASRETGGRAEVHLHCDH